MGWVGFPGPIRAPHDRNADNSGMLCIRRNQGHDDKLGT